MDQLEILKEAIRGEYRGYRGDRGYKSPARRALGVASLWLINSGIDLLAMNQDI